MTCKSGGSTRYFYTGNQVGFINNTGCFNYVGGGKPGSGISAGVTLPKFFPGEISRALWERGDAALSQELLDASHPFIELNWIADIEIAEGVTLRVSDRNIYVEDENGDPRFYEARAENAPQTLSTAGEWLNPKFEIGNVTIMLNNRDGHFNQYLPQGENYVQWLGGKVKIFVGFGEKRSNYTEVFRGIIPHKKGVETTLESISINAYDRFEEDEVPIPATTFDKTNYPFVDPDKIGKVLPIVYGDWTEEVGEFGHIPAFCTNAVDTNVSAYVWAISENALRSIDEVWLHRGNRNPDGQGPIRLLDGVITKDLERGRILIPAGVPVLSEEYVLIDNGRPGAGSGVDLILAASADQNFLTLGVQPGDTVIKDGALPPHAVVQSVTSGQLVLTGGISFSEDDGYRVVTDKYVWRKGDKVSVKCTGKDVTTMAITRLSAAGILDANPGALSIGLQNDYWFPDNDAQKIYHVSFDDKVIEEIPYANIDGAITEITGLDIQFDGSLWFFDRPQSKIYRYLPNDEEVGLSFTTLEVSGLQQLLSRGGPLTIDEGNVLTIHDQITGNFYRIAPFAGAQPGLQSQFNRNDFNPLALDVVDIAADVNEQELVVLDRSTQKVYRIDAVSGGLKSGKDFPLTDVSGGLNQPRGVGYFIDGTLFFLDAQDNQIYNYNEFDDANENPGFIARDILQSYAGKSTFDFDLKWNEACRNNLSQFRGRISIDDATTVVQQLVEFMQSFNTNVHLNLQKYSLFYIGFENFRTDGNQIREGDIEKGSFSPRKEFNQYFNTAVATYAKSPFNGDTIRSDTYLSPTGRQLAGKEILKELELPFVYRRNDIDTLLPLFVRLAAAEPEFVELKAPFRFMFAQLNTFYNINFRDLFNKDGSLSGRRFDNIPSFVRSVGMDLGDMGISLKLWSLGTTRFGDFVPVGTVAGGQLDQIILTNLGTAGYVAPVGDITASGAQSLTLADVGLDDAETREAVVVGKAWQSGHKLGLFSGSDHTLVEVVEVDQVTGDTISLKEVLVTAVQATVRNSAGRISGGHYLKHIDYGQAKQPQKDFYAYFGPPLEGYPDTTTEELEEQRAGIHDFADGRLPYVLHPVNFVPS